jgi:2-oxoisovalerate dehydrogenase E1 component
VTNKTLSTSPEWNKDQILKDYTVAYQSRYASLIGRKEVLSGKAKFGIFGDGKELAQVAMARVFRNGDWRSGYYRDQTVMMALGQLSLKQFFAQLFADTNTEHDPASGGRQMNNHFATRLIAHDGSWLDQLAQPNTSSDVSPTGGQMARLVGLAYASKLFRDNKRLHGLRNFSDAGNEIAFGTIGNASTSEGLFWEAMNAAGVLQIPMLMSVWDDDYGISVHAKHQTTKQSISKIMAGFDYETELKGIAIHIVKGWDYPSLIKTYTKAADACRRDHIPQLIHVIEMTQPQGHSTSGSHERYKSKERLSWEDEFDCLARFKGWIIEQKLAPLSALESIENEALKAAETAKEAAWQDYLSPIEHEREDAIKLLESLSENPDRAVICQKATQELRRQPVLLRRNIQSTLKRALYQMTDVALDEKLNLIRFLERYHDFNQRRYSSHLFSESSTSPLLVGEVPARYSESSLKVDGRQVIQKFFEKVIERDPRIFICGEDVGQLGGVNLEFEGLQEKFGDLHVTDTGIREATILGQGIGAAMRGLKPIADIQYLDYLLYCYQGMSDDLATLHYRSAGGQLAPVIVRTKGHRLEGIWHTGSPMGMIIHGIRGIHVCVPRNMVQAAGMYNTLLKGDDPALVIEVLNGYRQKETLPDNIGEYTVSLGVPEILEQGSDVTLVTYGACIRIAQEATKLLKDAGISVELIDVQTLLPFDRFGIIKESINKTSALVCMDEDVPGGASAFILQQIVEEQKAYELLDAPPRTLTAKPHRSAYGSDGDYYSKPNAEDLFELIYDMMHERNPEQFAPIK